MSARISREAGRPVSARRSMLMLGFGTAIGFGIGLLWPPNPGAAPQNACADQESSTASMATTRPRQVAARPPRSEEATVDSMWMSLQLAAQAKSLQSSLDTALDELDRRKEARELVSNAITQLGEPELRGVLATALRLSSHELDEIGDLQAFAARASEIAMAGLIYEEPEPAVGGEVFFTAVMPDSNSEIDAADHFSADDDRIFAVFQTPTDHSQRITMKWSRTDDPEILLFARRNIRPEDEYGFVYRRRGNGWTPGEYRVDVFGGDEAMQPLATGRYVIE